MPSERWLPVVGYEGLYEVSDLGRVRSLDRDHTFRDRWGVQRPRRIRGQLLRPQVVFGYSKVPLNRQGHGSDRQCVHVLVLTAFVGPRPEGLDTRHLNGVRADCRLENLVWGTKAQNEADKLAHGTLLHGESHPSSKLTAREVADIRAAYRAREVSCRALGEQYGVSLACIQDIVSGRSWRSEPSSRERQHAV